MSFPIITVMRNN